VSDTRIASQIGGPGSVSGAVFTDVNSNGALDGTDITLANISVYVDFNNNGILDGAEPSSVTNNSGTYNISNLSPGTYTVRQIVQPGLSQVNPDPIVNLSLVAPAAQANFINTPGAPIGPGNVNTITGIVFNDENFNGLRESNESGIEGIQVYLDSNNNNIFDSNEALVFTDNIGSYTFSNLAAGVYNVKQIANPPATETSRSPLIFFNNQPQTVVVDLGNSEVKTVGSVSGFKYFDADGNGLRDVNEPGIPNYTIYADVNSNGFLDSNEPFTLTGNDGAYFLPNLPATRLVIREVGVAGVSQTSQSPVVDLTNCDDLTEINFGNTPLNIITGEIRGFVFNDANRDGTIDAGATGIPNVPLFLDANNNNIFDPQERVTNTDAIGNYTFAQVTPGYYVLRQVPVAGLDKITPDPVVGITPENLFLPAVNFANSPSIVAPPITPPTTPNTPGPVGPDTTTTTTTTRTASQVAPGVNQIGGVVFNDVNANGLVEANEVGLPGFTTYLDTNNNSTLDSGEPSTISDAQGQYRFNGLPVGTYVVKGIAQTGFTQSTPDPVITVDPGVNANFVNIGFSGGPVGPGPGPLPPVGIPDGLIPGPGRIVGTKFNDLNGNGFPDANDPVISGIPIYLDINNNGIGEVNEPFTVTNSAGNYEFSNVPAGTYRVREQLAPGVTQTTVDPAVVVTPGQSIVYNFGNSTVFGQDPYSSSISGVVYEDTNDNDVFDAGDFGFAGNQIYIDLNANEFFDPGENSTTTNERGEYIFRAVPPGTYNVRQNLLPGQDGQIEQVSDNPGPITVVVPNDNPSGINFRNAFMSIEGNTISGIKFNDLNSNGFYEPFAAEAPIPGVEIFLDLNNDGQIQGFEPNQITGPDGTYGLNLDHVGEGQYVLREVDRGGFYQTTPLVTIDYVTGESYVYNFGNAPQSTISGTVFNDLNGNGFPDNGEKELFGIPNVQVYIDSDFDGFLDNNETSTFSAANGAYAFVGLNAPGTYPIRTVAQPNIFQTTPVGDITVGLGQNITYDIGNNVVPINNPVVPPIVDPNAPIV